MHPKGKPMLSLISAVCLCLAVLAVLSGSCNGRFEPPPTPVGALAPTVALEPTVTRHPTVTVEPTVSMLPTAVMEPTVAVDPTIEMLPTVAMLPTVELEPTVSMAPSGFAAPDPVEGIGDVQEALIGGELFQLEVARTSQERAQGLMHRESLAIDSAMLFVFDDEAHRSFWMKNTLIPLDILYLDSRGVVVDVQTMTTQVGVADSELTRYPSAAPARYAIEMNAGLANVLGVESGAQVLFR